ncbi:MAG: adenylate/guanylate cyclase domain-containing protein, partial [Sideroxyarcus sp.]|nr:adenylate/guanylate cyclase domain-containing protein [Sideroxyarcus sp.]
MEQRGNKTIVCSVFFLDIVEYSKRSVAGQISLKERFNAFLSIAIRDVPIGDRIILDTGDGAAISFLGDIEDALQAALSMRSSLLGEGVRMEPALLVRMGVNLGPVRLVKDINGQPNIVGDGINVAQRVMGFADPGQILVSRSYYDAVSRLSQEYAGMFHYQGSRTDKHVREHEVYAIGYPGDFTSTQRSFAIKQQVENATGMALFFAIARNYWDEFIHHVSVLERRGLEAFRRASTPQRAVIVGSVAVVLLSMMMGIYKLAQRPAPPSAKQLLASQVREATLVPVSAPAAAVPAASAPGVSVPIASAPVAAAPANEKAAAKAEGEKKIQGVKQSARVRTLAETTGGPAVVSL